MTIPEAWSRADVAVAPPAEARRYHALRRTLRLWALSFACVIPIIIVTWTVLYLGRQHTPRPFRMFEAFMFVLDWSIWAALAPLVIALAWRIPFDRGRWFGGLSAHLLLSGVVAFVQMMLFIVLARALGAYPDGTFADTFWLILAVWYPYDLVIYWVIAIAAYSYDVSRRARVKEVEAAELREQLSTAQLDALRMQLHPHFLCNTLNTVAVFLRDGRVEEAEAIVTGMGELMHIALARMDAQEVPLAEELAFAQKYLEIERRRFSDRMEVSVEVDPGSMEALVPCMILQPVVENAVRHGISRDPNAGRVAVRAARRDGRLHLTVEDDGPGFGSGPSQSGHGVGLHNARMRLDRLYHGRGSLRVGKSESGGGLVEIVLPFHSASSPSVQIPGRRNGR